MTRERKLKEVLNVRLDEPLAREIARVAAAQGLSESAVARQLLEYGIEVARRLEVEGFARPFAWREATEDEPHPTIVEIQARRRQMTDEEIDAHGYRGYVGYVVDEGDPDAG